MDIAAQVSKIIAEQLAIPEESVTKEATLTVLGADSLDVVELIMRFEDEFDIEIKDEDVESLATVADVVAYLRKTVAEQQNIAHT